MDVKKIRAATGLNQRDFWGRIYVTQSGGSRYESGRQMPKPVETSVLIAYGTESERERVLKRLVFVPKSARPAAKKRVMRVAR